MGKLVRTAVGFVEGDDMGPLNGDAEGDEVGF